jgi:hypothetical protein
MPRVDAEFGQFNLVWCGLHAGGSLAVAIHSDANEWPESS